MIIEAFRNYVIFSFIEKIVGERFVNSSGGSIILSSDDKAQTTYPRWVKVAEVGPDVKDITAGEYALVEAGKWTAQFRIDGTRYWKTDSDHVLCTADSPGSTY